MERAKKVVAEAKQRAAGEVEWYEEQVRIAEITLFNLKYELAEKEAVVQELEAALAVLTKGG